MNDGDTVLTIEYAGKIIKLIEESRRGIIIEDTSVQEFLCTICGDRFSTQENLNEHIGIELAEEPIEEKDTFVADADDIHRELSDKWY